MYIIFSSSYMHCSPRGPSFPPLIGAADLGLRQKIEVSTYFFLKSPKKNFRQLPAMTENSELQGK